MSDEQKKTIYLHIGMQKAGSTSIQAFLYENRIKLQDYDVFYPVVPNDKNEKNYNIDEYINYRQVTLKVIQKGFKAYNKFFEEKYLTQINNNCSKIILSDEIMFAHQDTVFADALLNRGFDVKVIVYVRKPAEYITSLWQERIKPYSDSKVGRIEDFMLSEKAGYELILKYIEKLGKDNVIVRPFENAQWKNGNLYEDFLCSVGVDSFCFDGEIQRKNYSYNRNLCEFLLLIRDLNLPREELNEVLYDYARVIVPDTEKDKIEADSPVNITDFIEKYSDLNPKIIETIPDELIFEVTEKYRPVLSKIAEYYNKESIFISDYPKCYKKEREKYNQLTLSYQQLRILYKAMKIKNSLKDKNRKIPFYKYIFSVNKEKSKKIIRLFGFKITLH